MSVRRRRAASNAIECLEHRRLFASVANKVADINLTSAFLEPGDFTPVGTSTYFTARAYQGDGKELWVTDGTTAGTRRVMDIRPGKASSTPSNFIAVGDTLYFAADDGVHGKELWRSDGTEAGTRLVADIYPGSTGSTPGGSMLNGATNAMVDNNGTLYFTATDAIGATSLFKTDGTVASTTRITNANYAFSSRTPLAVLNGTVIFGASTTTVGNASLYRVNASSPVGGPVTTLKAFTTSARPSHLTVFNDRVYFSADQDVSNKGDLWSTDGSPTGTRLEASIGSANLSNPNSFRRSGNLLYFANYDIALGRTELWRTDGTSAGTLVLANNLPVDADTNRLVPTGANGILFRGNVSGLSSTNLYRSGGTPATTGSIPVPAGVTVSNVLGANGRYFVTATDADGGLLYMTDGTGDLALVADLGTHVISAMGLLQGDAPGATPDLLFARTTIAGVGELWRSDGTPPTTVRLGTSNGGGTASSMWDFTPAGFGSHPPTAFTKLGSGVVFAVDDGIHGQEVWTTNPQTGVTRMLADVNVGAGASNPSDFAVDPSNGIVYFQAYTPATGKELFRILPGGTVQLVADLVAGSGSSAPRDLTIVGTSLYFTAVPNVGGGVLYHTSLSTGTGATAISDGTTGLNNPGAILVNGTRAYVSAISSSGGITRTYLLNGTSPATALATSVSIYGLGWGDKNYANVGDVTYFAGYDVSFNRELWRTDGTPTGTYRVKDISSQGSGTEFGEFTAFNGKVYFWAKGAFESKSSLWVSDGTDAGTMKLAAATGVSNIESIAQTRSGQLHFIGTGGDGIVGIHRYDGTAMQRIIDATPSATPTLLLGKSTGIFEPFYVAQDKSVTPNVFSLYRIPFNGSTPELVKTLWVRDPLDASMNSTWGNGRGAFQGAGNRLYFPAYRPEWGVEPHSYVMDPIASEINGYAYLDFNRDGDRDTTDLAAQGFTVYVDLDNDGTRDPDEPTNVVNANGFWSFRNLDINNTYHVRLILPDGYAQSEPAGNGALVRTMSNTGAQSGTGFFGLIDESLPTVTSVIVDRDAPHFAIKFTFSEHPALASLHPDDLYLTDPHGVPITTSNFVNVTYDAATRTATFTFPSKPMGLPGSGWMQASLRDGAVRDLFGNGNPATVPLPFTILIGDADDDHDVDFSDLLILAKNYNGTGKTFSQGNFDRDANGNVDFADLLLLAKAYNTDLGAIPPAAVPPAMATAAPSRRRTRGDVLS